MHIVFLILAGILSGVVGGMGMGGGTILVPILTLLFGFTQQLSQSTNLLSSIPMGICGISTHIKNKLIEYKYVLLMSGGTVTSVLASLLVKNMNSAILKRYFGIFIICIAIIQIIIIIYQRYKKSCQK